MTHNQGWFTSSLVRSADRFHRRALVRARRPHGSRRGRQQRARLSKDLSDRLAARVEAPTDVIVAGSDEQIEALATRYGARVKKRLRNAAVLEVSGGQLRDLSEDAEVASVSGDVPVRAMATVTAEAIGADQVWTGASQGLRGLPAAASAWR